MRPKRLILIAVCAALCLSACGKNRSRTVALPPPPVIVPPPPEPPPPVVQPEPEPASPPPAPAPPGPLELADAAFDTGSCEDAARGYEEFLRLEPSSAKRDHALFRLGLCSALRASPGPDWPRATAALKQLLDEYPGSPLRPAAAVILSLRAEIDKTGADLQSREQRIKQLSSELDRLRKIDADRRKRP